MATVGLNVTFPTKPYSASANVVVSSPVDSVLTLIDVKSVWMLIAAISKSMLDEGGLPPLVLSLGQGGVGFAGEMGMAFVGLSLTGELTLPVEALPEASLMGVMSTGAGLRGVSSGRMTQSKSPSAE